MMKLKQRGKINKNFLGKTLMTIPFMLILTLSLFLFLTNTFEDYVPTEEYTQFDEDIIVPGDTENEVLDLESEVCIYTIFE